MSHSHRDDLELVGPEPAVAESLELVPPAPIVANAEAERRAQERRKLEGIGEQITQHEFTGDLPDPDGGDTEVETQLILGSSDEDSDDAVQRSKASSARRGPPPPRFAEPDTATSWAASGSTDAATLRLPTTSWSMEPG